MKICFAVATTLFFGIGAIASETSRDPSLLFEATFEKDTLTADYAKGDHKCFTIPNAGLKAANRAMEGVGKKGTALSIDRTVDCLYNMKDNLDMKQGTVSMWVAPLNWKTGNEFIEVFFGAGQKDFSMYVQKYLWSNHLMFYYQNQMAPGQKKAYSAVVLVDEKDWPEGKWHKLDAVWDVNGIKLYVDGVLPKAVEWRKPEVKFDASMEFPASAWGWISIAKKSDEQNKISRTAFDNVRIYGRPLSAEEINANYQKEMNAK